MVLQNLKFDERGLIPTIVQDRLQRHIIMFSYMNPEALALTLQTGIPHFWNPTKQRVRRQIDISGQQHRVVDIIADDEGDAIIIQVESLTPPTQTTKEPVFHPNVTQPESKADEVSIVNMRSMEIGLMLSELFQLIKELERERPENSYTAHLLQGGLDVILKKLHEQMAETTIAAKNNVQQKLSSQYITLILYT